MVENIKLSGVVTTYSLTKQYKAIILIIMLVTIQQMSHLD